MKRGLIFAALTAAALFGHAAAFEVVSDGAATAFYVEAGAVEAGGNFLYLVVTTPDGRSETIQTSCFPLVDDDGSAFPWKNYGDLVPATARAFVVLPRTWPRGTRFEAILLDRDGAELVRREFCMRGAATPRGRGAMVNAETFTSPNGLVSCDFSLRDGVPVAVVSFNGRRVFESELGYVCERLEPRGAAEAKTVTRTWKPVWGFRSVYPENYAERTVKLGVPGEARAKETLVLRCYDEGFAVQAKLATDAYCLNEIRGERTSWKFADGAKAWCIPETEATFPQDPTEVAALDAAAEWRMPFLVEMANGDAAAVLEANVKDYPRSYLKAKDGVLRPKFVVGVKEGRGEIVSPWRAVQLAGSAARLVETAYFVENLNDPCALADTSWIRPGLSVSDHGNCELETDAIIAAAREAKKIGATSFQIDWGWYGTEHPWSDDDRAAYRALGAEGSKTPTWEANTYADPYRAAKGYVPYHPYKYLQYGRQNVDFDVPKVVAELKKMDMQLGLYLHGSVLEAQDLDKLFATYESWGVAALKPGFVSFGSQRATEFLRKLAETAAKHRLWLDIHDAQIPDGFERTYPNVMITEGVGGEEGGHVVRQDVALPFTRGLCGPFDFTPELFKVGKSRSSKAHKVAMFLAYPGPTAVMRGNVRKLLETDASILEFVRALPWSYDSTHVLEASVARHFVILRGRGDAFYLAGMTGEKAHVATLDFGFLPAGRDYAFTLWRDAKPDEAAEPPRGYVRETRVVRSGDVVKVPMAPAGGFVATLVEVK